MWAEAGSWEGSGEGCASQTAEVCCCLAATALAAEIEEYEDDDTQAQVERQIGGAQRQLVCGEPIQSGENLIG